MHKSNSNFRRHFRAYLHAHSRVLTFAGALIVFTTFIVKEGLRERVKDLSDSIEDAETVFALRSDTGEVMRTLADIQTSLNRFNDRIQSEPPLGDGLNPPNAGFLRETADMVRTRVLAERLAFDNLERLIEKLPMPNQNYVIGKSDSVKKEIDALLPQLDEEDAYGDQLEKIVTSNKKLSPSDIAAVSEVNVRARASLQQVIENYRRTMADFDSVTTDVLSYSQMLKVFGDRLYSWFTWASYILYTVGWGLGLLTRIYGGEAKIQNE